MKVPWTEHKTNEEILKMVETGRKIMDIVRSRQKIWLGHILAVPNVTAHPLTASVPTSLWFDVAL